MALGFRAFLRKHSVTLSTAALGLVLMAGFQNCSGVKFNAQELLSKRACVPNSAPELEPVLKFAWIASPTEPSPEWKYVMSTPAVGDISDDGVPEIVFTSFANDSTLGGGATYNGRGVLRVIRGTDGKLVGSLGDPSIAPMGSTTPLLIDIDGNGTGEIVYTDASHTNIIALNSDLSLRWKLNVPGGIRGASSRVCNGGFAGADLDGDGRAEIIADRVVVRENSLGVGEVAWQAAAGAGCTTFAASFDASRPNQMQVLMGDGLYSATGTLLWAFPAALAKGFFAAADIDTNLPGLEIAVVSASKVHLVSAASGNVLWSVDVPQTRQCPGGKVGHGGPPTIADMNGDGSPDIGAATGMYYTVFKKDGQPLWYKETRDCSSSITGSSLFDFNGDGRNEVIYGDELFARIYDGITGTKLFELPNPQHTLLENPIVVDVDGNGSSELITVTNNYLASSFYDDAGPRADEVRNTPPGLRVYAARSQAGWVPTRKVWNQYSYFIHNVSEKLRAASSTPVTLGAGAGSFRQNKLSAFDKQCI